MRLMLVEDDSIILRGLGRALDWTAFGIDDVLSASDGEMALSCFISSPSDIVMTDIDMPFLNGLELAEKIHAINPDTIVIILTGFDNFEYAKKALKLGCFDYLMKPIRPEEIEKCIRKAIEAIESKNWTAMKMQKGLRLMREEFLDRLSAQKLEEEEYEKTIQLLDLERIEGKCCFGIILLDDNRNSNDYSLDYDNIVFELVSYIEEKLSGYVWHSNGNTIKFISSDPDGCSSFMNEVADFSKSRCHAEISVFIGSESDTIFTVHNSARDAYACSMYGILSDDAVLVYKDNISDIALDSDRKILERFERCLIEGNAANVSMIIDSIGNMGRLANMPMKILFHISDLIMTGKINIEGVDRDRMIDGFPVQAGLKVQLEYLKSVSGTICSRIEESSGNISVNRKMLDYILKNYSNPMISLTTLGDYMNLSPVYLCSLFKQKNGKSFSEFLAEIRIEKACELLKNSSMKNYEISNAVGIPNAQYFCSRFKRETGMTPQEYRDSEKSPQN